MALRLIGALGIALLALGVPSPVHAGEGRDQAEEVNLPATLVTEGALPATEAEAVFQLSRTSTEVTWELAPSVQYAPVPWFGVKLAVPLDGVDPREEPAQAGVGDVSVVAKYAPVILPARQVAVSGGLKLTVPTGDAERDLGGTFAVAPFVMAGKGFGPFSLQADAGYSWKLNRPARIEEEGEEGVQPDKKQEVTANLAVTFSPVERLGLILELNSVTRVAGEDDGLRDRIQLSVTPGVSVEPAKGWNIRAGVQLPATSAKEFDYNVVVILTKGL